MEDLFALLAARHQLHDQAGRSPEGLRERYLYSTDMVYRYAFGRWWHDQDLASTDVWVLLNPATGDTERRRRPTLERCITRSCALGATGHVVVNLFAHRHTDPRTLEGAAEPIGPANDDVLHEFATTAPRTIAAWGSHGRVHGRSLSVGPLLTKPYCLGTTKRGGPRHPLYVRSDAELSPGQPGPTDEGAQSSRCPLSQVSMSASAARAMGVGWAVKPCGEAG